MILIIHNWENVVRQGTTATEEVAATEEDMVAAMEEEEELMGVEAATEATMTGIVVCQ